VTQVLPWQTLRTRTVIKVSPPPHSHRVSCCANSTVQSDVISRERLLSTCPSTRSLLSVWQSKQCSSRYTIVSYPYTAPKKEYETVYSIHGSQPSRDLFSRSEVAEDSSPERDAMLLGKLFPTFRRIVVSSCSPSRSPR